MGRLMAIDYGLKRVGIAVTDPLQIIASPLETVLSKDIFTFLKKYTATEQVDKLVIGKAVDLMGRDTDSTVPVQKFVVELEKQFPGLAYEWHDERYTSKMAMQAMIAGGMSKANRRIKGNVDKVSAAIILQSYMESKSNL
jgi:putative holliday junction resolvase